MLLSFASFGDSIRNFKNNEEISKTYFPVKTSKRPALKNVSKTMLKKPQNWIEKCNGHFKNCFQFTGTDFSASEESTLMFGGLIVTIGGLFVLG